MCRLVGMKTWFSNGEDERVQVNAARLVCHDCDEQVVATWRSDEDMSSTCRAVFDEWRMAHRGHEGFSEGLPEVKLVSPFSAPAVGSTSFERYPLSAPPPPPSMLPPTPGQQGDGGGPPPWTSSHYDYL